MDTAQDTTGRVSVLRELTATKQAEILQLQGDLLEAQKAGHPFKEGDEVLAFCYSKHRYDWWPALISQINFGAGIRPTPQYRVLLRKKDGEWGTSPFYTRQVARTEDETTEIVSGGWSWR